MPDKRALEHTRRSGAVWQRRFYDFVVFYLEEMSCSIFKIVGPQNRKSILAARILMLLSASIVFTLGVVHLIYTFWGQNSHPVIPGCKSA